MEIAILMSTYNGHKYLDEQLKSIANQTVVKQVHLYIRDDGSSDDTIKIIKKWKTKINITLYQEKNVGPAKSFWELLTNPKIKADYYAFCDQDDIWDSDKLESGIRKLKGNVHFYASNCRIIDGNGNIIKKIRNKSMPQMSLKNLFVTGCTQGCAMIFTDDLCKFIRNSSITCVPMHDIVVMIYAKMFGKIYWDQMPRFNYRVHSSNVVAKNNKNIFLKMKTTYWNWKNSSKNSMAIVAKELLNNCKIKNLDSLSFLKNVEKYKASIKSKWIILNDAEIKSMKNNVLRSYKVRILLNLY